MGAIAKYYRITDRRGREAVETIELTPPADLPESAEVKPVEPPARFFHRNHRRPALVLSSVEVGRTDANPRPGRGQADTDEPGRRSSAAGDKR